MDERAFLLNHLRDIHLADPPSWWPLAMGWHIVMGLLLFLLIWIIVRNWWRWQRLLIKRKVISDIDKLKDSYLRNEQQENILATISILLKRVALVYYKREQIASLYGEKWLRFLDQTGQTHEFTKGYGRCLATAPYQKGAKVDVLKVIEICRLWIKRR